MSGAADDPMRRLAHDLRTQLAVVAGFAELLERRDEALDPASRAEYLARIRAAAGEMEALLASAEGAPPPS